MRTECQHDECTQVQHDPHNDLDGGGEGREEEQIADQM